MQKIFILLSAVLFSNFLKAQKVDSIYFHLYTDSLKKGVYNYINVDARLQNGRAEDRVVIVQFARRHISLLGGGLVLRRLFFLVGRGIGIAPSNKDRGRRSE